MRNENLPKERIVKTFFGWKKIPEIVITTPISLFFRKIIKKEKETKKSWFPSKKIKRNVGIVKLPSGRGCEDVFETLSWFQTKVIHLGFSCGISSSINIGDIVFIESSYWKGVERKSYFYGKKIFPESIRNVKGLTVNSILKTYKIGKTLTNIEVTDMETSILYEKIQKSMSINVVSDSLKHPFFSLSRLQKRRISISIETLVNLVLKELINLI